MKRWLNDARCTRAHLTGLATLLVLGLVAVGVYLYVAYVTLD